MIQIKVDMRELSLAEKFVKEERKVVLRAARRSLNRVITSTQKELMKEVREVLRLKTGEIKSRYLELVRARGNSLESLSGMIKISADPVSMIRLVVGPQSPRPQAGIPVRKRKALSVHIVPGRKVKTKYFIARGKQGNVQVFARAPGSRKLVKQSVPSVGHHVVNKNNGQIVDRLSRFASERMFIEFAREHAFELDRAATRAK